MLPDTLVFSVVDNPGYMIRGDFLKNRIEYRRGELCNGADRTSNRKTVLFGNVVQKFLWDGEFRLSAFSKYI